MTKDWERTPKGKARARGLGLPLPGTPGMFGPEFAIYSVGADFKDDGGETNEAFSTPDLRLEGAGQ